MEIELSNGTILELPDGTAPEAARNYAIRAEAKLKSAADNQAAREQSQAAPAEPTNMFGATPTLDRFGLKGLREGASSVLGTETGLPAFVGRGLLSRNPIIGMGDLGTALFNIMSRGAGADNPNASLSDAPMPPPDTPQLDPSQAPARGAPIQIPYPSQVIGEAIGLPQQTADTGMGEKIAESIISFGRTGVPLSTGATGARAASPMVQRGANFAGQVAGGTTAALGSDFGAQLAQQAGIDPDIGAILGGLTGGATMSAVNNVPARLATQHLLADRNAPRTPQGDPGPASTFFSPNQGSIAALNTVDAAGVTPSPGLIGNQTAARLENTAAGVPAVGIPARSRQDQQLRQFQDRTYQQSEALGGAQGQEAMGDYYLGDRAKLIAQRGQRNQIAEENQRYAEIDRGVPPEMHVRPVETYTEANRILQPGSGESAPSRAGVETALTRNLDPQVQANRTVQDTPHGPVEVVEQGIPYADVRPTASSLFETAEGTRSPASAGAQDQVRQAFTLDTTSTLENHPLMVQAFPDPADRAMKAEQLRVANREYAQERATDTVGTGMPMFDPQTGEAFGGGAIPILRGIQGAPDEAAAYRQAAKPGAMEVLQRTNPNDYGEFAGNVLAQSAQAKVPSGTTNIAPVALANWWRRLGPNEQMVMANNNPDVVAQLNTLADTADRFRQRSFTQNTSNTSPMMSTVGAFVAASADPMMVLNKAFGAAAGAAGISSDTLARYVARTNPQAFQHIMSRANDALRASSGMVADPRDARLAQLFGGQ